ncbi:MAG: type II toxin-antitoxin system RelE/ParE family toxin [Deltaproteobacteria bacterium]|nr:type II toxin-antitoxin system RelE/ParE family toxin [Deltaproteobacteria bacterium]
MIVSFADQASKDIYDDTNSREARRRLPRELWALAQRKLSMLNVTRDLAQLRNPPGNRLEALRGDRQGQWSLRINDQYRVVFSWSPGEASDVEIVDYH